jgi:HD-GYP domain-containing protein (c-di-GMP phosphodiesterase class II)
MSESASRDILPEKLWATLFRLIQTLRVHDQENASLRAGADEFAGLLAMEAAGEPEIRMEILHGRLIFQGEKVPHRAKTARMMDQIARFMEILKVRGFSIQAEGYLEARGSGTDPAVALARLLGEAARSKDPAAVLFEGASGPGLEWLEIIPATQEAPAEPKQGQRAAARQTYAHGMESLQEVAQKLAGDQRVGISKTVRIAQEMVDLIVEDDSLLMTLSTLRTYDDYTFHHSVNVAILSMCLGNAIQLSKPSLERLAVCGMLHDLGKVEIPVHILNKPGRLTAAEFEEVKKHSLNSTLQILKIKAGRERRARLIAPPFEHHLKYDLSGYPRSPRKTSLSLFGRILTITDVYDAITSPRKYRESVMSPDEALGYMLKGAGTDFDPVLLKVFIRMMGIYPVGTMVLLDTGEIGLVRSGRVEGPSDRPHLIHLIPDGDNGFQKGKELDMLARNPKTQTYRRNIVRSFHPSTFGVQPADFLF